MRVPRLYLPGDYQANQVVALSKEQVHYVVNVLRLKNQHPVKVFNGCKQEALATLLVTGRRSADLAIESVSEPLVESPLNTVLVQCISKGDRMDHSIQKSVELGVKAIQPVFSDRCDVKLKADKLEKRRQQWQSIAISAAEQSGRVILPEILPIQTLNEHLSELESSTFTGLVLDPTAEFALQQLPTPVENQPIHILIGPEGGLSSEEVTAATQAGFTPIRFGPRILRTETAGPVVLASLQMLWGDI